MPGPEPGKKFPAILPTSAPMERFSSQPSPLSPWSSWGLLTLVGLALFFLRLGAPGLMDPDEGRYAEIAREMLLLRDWLIPHLNLVPYLEKPPLVYWLTSASFTAFGFAEWAARLPAALAALAGLYLAYGLGRTLGGERQGLFGALVLATCGGYVILARLLTLDMVFSFFLNLGIALGYLALSRERRRLWLSAYLALALAVLVKGPVALVLAGLIWGLAALLKGRQAILALIRPGSWALLAAVVLPWFFLVARRYPQFPRFFLWEHHVERYVDGLAYHAEPWWYFGPVLLGILLPWTGLLPWALGRRGAINSDDRRFLVLWAWVVLAFFSLSRGKLVTYILPALLPLALLVGDGLAALPSGEAGRRRPPGLRVSLLIWALLGWLLVALHAWPPGALAPLLHEAAFLEPYLLITLVLLALIPSVTLVLPNVKVLLAGALLFGALLPLGMERLALKRSPKELGLALRSQWQPGAALVGVNLYSQGLSFYSGHVFHLLRFRTELNFGDRLVPDSGLFFQNFEELQDFAATRHLLFFYLKAKDVSWFKDKLPREYEVVGRQNDCVLLFSHRK
jgi:4-amino-4-deoxy-L-arabinose transferase-like glycosyltransferase